MPAQLPAVLCVATGLANCLDSQAFYGQVVKKYLQCHAADASALESALQAGDIEQAIHIVHTLVSSSATVGALALEQQSRGVLATLRATASVPAPSTIQAFSQAHDQATRALTEWVNAPAQAAC